MAVVLQQKGGVLISIGIARNTKVYLSIGETLYLAELGTLMLVDSNDKTVSLKNIYENVAAGKGGFIWEHFEIYGYLKSLGYVVGRNLLEIHALQSLWQEVWSINAPFIDLHLRLAVIVKLRHPPSISEIVELEKQCSGISLKIIHVEHGRVSFFSFERVALPTLP